MRFVFGPLFIRRAATVVAAATLAGCATLASTPEAVVRERATQHWKARLASDFDTTYKYTTPSYRGANSLQKYKSGFGGAVVLKSAEVASVVCDSADKCVVNTKVEAQPTLTIGRRALPPIVTHVDETWLREDGQWWLFPTP